MRRMFDLGIFALVMFLLLSCAGSNTSFSRQTLSVKNEIPIPPGYSLVGVSTYGRYLASSTFYCENIETKKVFTCNNGVLGKEIILPSGYSLAEVASYGDYIESITFYCRLNGTNRIFICRPE